MQTAVNSKVVFLITGGGPMEALIVELSVPALK